MVIIFAIFINRLDERQIEYAEQFQDNTIEMNDFCLKFSDLPRNEFFDRNEHILRAQFWAYLKEIMKDEEAEAHLDGSQAKYDIVDITFGNRNMDEANLLFKLSDNRQKRLLLEKKLKVAPEGKKTEKDREKLE